MQMFDASLSDHVVQVQPEAALRRQFPGAATAELSRFPIAIVPQICAIAHEGFATHNALQEAKEIDE